MIYWDVRFYYRDVITKQTIIHLHNQNNKKLIIKDLDDTHLLVDPEWVEFIKEATFNILEKNLYSVENGGPMTAVRR